MKQVAIAAIALVVGLVLGGLKPKAELREVQTEQAQLCAAPCPESTVGRDLAQFFGGARTMAPRDESPREQADRLAEENPEASLDLTGAPLRGVKVAESI